MIKKKQDRPEPVIPSFAKDLLKETAPTPEKSQERLVLEQIATLLKIELKTEYDKREKNASELKWAIEGKIYQLQDDSKELKKIYEAYDTLARLQMMPYPPFWMGKGF